MLSSLQQETFRERIIDSQSENTLNILIFIIILGILAAEKKIIFISNAN